VKSPSRAKVYSAHEVPSNEALRHAALYASVLYMFGMKYRGRLKSREKSFRLEGNWAPKKRNAKDREGRLEREEKKQRV
jgi:hypothetical protein